jgi:hypothetical protein
MSPYLFLLCAEGFLALLNRAEVEGELEGIRLCNNALFSTICCLKMTQWMELIKANRESVKSLQNILHIYKVCSRKTINYNKSLVMFSANTRSVERKHVLEEFNISVEAMTEKYLRLPVHVGRYIINTFVYLKDRIWKKIHGWKERLLSKVGKDILIKKNAHKQLPPLLFHVLILQKQLCDLISAMIFRYWWAHNVNENKTHWLS